MTLESTRSFRLDYVPAVAMCHASPVILNGVTGFQPVIYRLDAYYFKSDPGGD